MISAPGEAVDGRVVDLGQHRHDAVLEPVDQIQLPQRPGAVERPGDDPRHLLGELLVGARRRQRELADVEVEVEVRVVDPVRVVEAERHLGQTPAHRRQQRQPLGEHLLDVGELELAARGGARIEDRDPADVPALARVLEREELGVEAGQLAHPQQSLMLMAWPARRFVDIWRRRLTFGQIVYGRRNLVPVAGA